MYTHNQKSIIYHDEFHKDEIISLVSQRLRYYLKSRSITIRQFSSAVRISTAAISSLRRGIGNPTIGIISQLSNFFGVSIQEFLGLSSTARYKAETKSIAIPIYDIHAFDRMNDSAIRKKLLIDISIGAENDKFFGIKPSSEGFSRVFKDNAIFVFTFPDKVADGDIVLFQSKDASNQIKRIYCKNNFYQLRSIDTVDAIEIHPKNETHICGVLVQIIQY